MSITINSVRYFTPGDPYHYTVDNRPLADLAQRDETLKSAIEAAFSELKLEAVVSGFLARGYASQNMMVGKLAFPGGLTFKVTRSLIVQEVELDPVGQPGVILPAIGIRAAEQAFTLTSPATGYLRPYSIQARRKAPSLENPPFYEGTGQDAANLVDDIEYQVKVGTDVTSGVVYPSIDAGWIEIFKIALSSNVTSINSALVQKINFKEEGAMFGAQDAGRYEYNHEQITVGSDSDTFTGIGINCNYAFVFVDGVIQYDVTRLTEDSIQFPEVIPAGSVIDLITTAGGEAVSASNSRVYQKFIATASQTVFNGVTSKNDSSLVFINGLLQDSSTWTIDDVLNTLTLSSGCDVNEEVVVLELKAIPFGAPSIPGGTIGQALVKNSSTDNDFSWQDISPTPSIPGGTTGQILAKASNTDDDYSWVYAAINPCQGIFTNKYPYVSNMEVGLYPFKGDRIVIDGSVRVIPSAGVTLNTTAAVTAGGVSRIYYVFAYWTGAAVALEAMVATAGSFTYVNGIAVKFVSGTPDPTRTLVGVFYAGNGTTSILQPNSTTRHIRSFYNEDHISSMQSFSNIAFGRTDVADVNSFTPSTVKFTYIQLPGDAVSYTVNGNLSGMATQRNLALYANDGATVISPYLSTAAILSSGRAAMTSQDCYSTDTTVDYPFSLSLSESSSFRDPAFSAVKMVTVGLYGSINSTSQFFAGRASGGLTGMVNTANVRISRRM